jgi:hypothetical protein
VGVFSGNTATGQLIQTTDAFVDVYGNPIEKFNDFLIYNLGMVNGLYAGIGKATRWLGIAMNALCRPTSAMSRLARFSTASTI